MAAMPRRLRTGLVAFAKVFAKKIEDILFGQHDFIFIESSVIACFVKPDIAFGYDLTARVCDSWRKAAP
jgi:hypothetical protein